jgi:8-oxo-dGTP pyrophosphatase MutT (NUDIX family)
LIEPGELPADAAIRETWEETGIIVRLRGIIGVFGGPDLLVTYRNGDLASYVGTIFRGERIGGELRPDGKEILDVRYFEPAEIDGVPHRSWMKNLLPYIFHPSESAYFQPGSWQPPR